jgi:hypothetical protein
MTRRGAMRAAVAAALGLALPGAAAKAVEEPCRGLLHRDTVPPIHLCRGLSALETFGLTGERIEDIAPGDPEYRRLFRERYPDPMKTLRAAPAGAAPSVSR